MTKVDTGKLDCVATELKAFVGMLRYMVEQCRPEDGMSEVFYTLANAADAIHANLEGCFTKTEGGAS